MTQIKKAIALILAPILAVYGRLVITLYKADDKQRRTYQKKKESLDKSSSFARFINFWGMLHSEITPKKFSLKEQKDLAEIVRMSIKFGNDNLLPWREQSRRSDLRYFVRQQCKEVADLHEEVDLHIVLQDRKVFHPEYVAMLKSAKTTGRFVDTYDRIILSLTEKIKRRNAYLMIMATPVFTFLIAAICEVLVAMIVVPEMVGMLNEGDVLPAVTQSYADLRNAILYHKLEWTVKLTVIFGSIYLFFKIDATKYLVDFLLVQLPVVNTLIARWEVSKFFQCINDMVKSSASPQEATAVSIGLISNRVIKHSMWNDVTANRERTSQLSEIFEDSVYVEEKIRNQLKIATRTNSKVDQLLDTIVEDYKESMNLLLEAPMKVIMPFTLALGALYIFFRLVPLFNEVNTILQNIGT